MYGVCRWAGTVGLEGASCWVSDVVFVVGGIEVLAIPASIFNISIENKDT